MELKSLFYYRLPVEQSPKKPKVVLKYENSFPHGRVKATLRGKDDPISDVVCAFNDLDGEAVKLLGLDMPHDCLKVQELKFGFDAELESDTVALIGAMSPPGSAGNWTHFKTRHHGLCRYGTRLMPEAVALVEAIRNGMERYQEGETMAEQLTLEAVAGDEEEDD